MPFLEEFWCACGKPFGCRSILAATVSNCVAMIRSGITAFYDCEEAPNVLPGILPAQAEVVREYGLRGILSFEATQRISPENGQLGLAENDHFIQAACEGGGLVSGMMCFHTTFTCDAQFIARHTRWRRIAMYWSAHCSEAYDRSMPETWKRPIQYYADLGVLSEHSLLSQCVQVDRAEIELLAKHRAQ
jgi:cytosine/adenosine deaminase-related metal-dependent hydrolase